MWQQFPLSPCFAEQFLKRRKSSAGRRASESTTASSPLTEGSSSSASPGVVGAPGRWSFLPPGGSPRAGAFTFRTVLNVKEKGLGASCRALVLPLERGPRTGKKKVQVQDWASNGGRCGPWRCPGPCHKNYSTLSSKHKLGCLHSRVKAPDCRSGRWSSQANWGWRHFTSWVQKLLHSWANVSA